MADCVFQEIGPFYQGYQICVHRDVHSILLLSFKCPCADLQFLPRIDHPAGTRGQGSGRGRPALTRVTPPWTRVVPPSTGVTPSVNCGHHTRDPGLPHHGLGHPTMDLGSFHHGLGHPTMNCGHATIDRSPHHGRGEAAVLSSVRPSPRREWWTQQRRTLVVETRLGRKRRCPSMNSGGRPALTGPAPAFGA